MNTTNNQYLYPLTIFDKVVKFNLLADMNQVVYALYHPSAKETINLTNFDEVVGYMTNQQIPFYIDQNKSIHDYALEYIEHIKPKYKHLTENDCDLIIRGFTAGFKKCRELGDERLPELSA